MSKFIETRICGIFKPDIIKRFEKKDMLHMLFPITSQRTKETHFGSTLNSNLIETTIFWKFYLFVFSEKKIK